MYRILIVALILLFITMLADALQISFTNDTLDGVWILICTLFWIFTIIKYTRYKIPVLLIIGIIGAFLYILQLYVSVFSGSTKEQTFYFDHNRIVKGYTVITGFMDAQSDYRIYQQLAGCSFLEKYLGTADGRGEKLYLLPSPARNLDR